MICLVAATRQHSSSRSSPTFQAPTRCVTLAPAPKCRPLAIAVDYTNIQCLQAVAPGGAITSQGPSVSYNSGYQAYANEEAEEEPEVIKEWRAKRDEGNAKRAEQFARQREETVAEAQRNIDDFYENYNSKKEKTIAATRKDAEQFLASREDTTSGGTSWERISKIVDVSGKGGKGGAAGSGKERFRELLTSLRKDEKAPGATGY